MLLSAALSHQHMHQYTFKHNITRTYCLETDLIQSVGQRSQRQVGFDLVSNPPKSGLHRSVMNYLIRSFQMCVSSEVRQRGRSSSAQTTITGHFFLDRFCPSTRIVQNTSLSRKVGLTRVACASATWLAQLPLASSAAVARWGTHSNGQSLCSSTVAHMQRALQQR
jgi:hypothetical protein